MLSVNKVLTTNKRISSVQTFGMILAHNVIISLNYSIVCNVVIYIY